MAKAWLPRRQFAIRLRGHRAIVQRTEPILQPAQPADEATCGLLAG